MSFAQRIFGAGKPDSTYPDPVTLRMPVPLDDMLTLLQNSRRRAVLQTLADADGQTVEMGPLAEKLAAQECDKPVDFLTSNERKRVYVALYQCHLPKLDEWGLVAFKDRNTHIATTPLTEHAIAYLDVLDAMHRRDVGDE